eukprot:CAMPEP_0173309636 /NCGR_PEP_ID=MMETSP1143-20121109/22443_1 /TAXON_ID=483371 /ORGANISM="non described non described, Strain CCMP2298" /LENGTH=144 /DNA_ID=CAMNT_0014251255 /DNA_START=185 /DNA_END=616 /DNA_ORIENTATION=+
MIGPIWGKISKSVWDGKAILYGGYGRRLQRSTISRDAPTYFNRPSDRFQIDTPTAGRKAIITLPAKERVHNESSYVLPGGASILQATQMQSLKSLDKRSMSRTYCHEGMTMLDNVVPARERTPINWSRGDSRGRDSKGQSSKTH